MTDIAQPPDPEPPCEIVLSHGAVSSLLILQCPRDRYMGTLNGPYLQTTVLLVMVSEPRRSLTRYMPFAIEPSVCHSTVW